jgi:hypothetical protein
MRFSLNIDIRDIFFKDLSFFNNQLLSTFNRQLLSTIFMICTLFACEINLDETPESKSKPADAMMDDTTKSCDCPDDVAYVCSTIWETYQNLCQLECAGAALMSEGECMGADDCSIACSGAGSYVCGVDGQTYESYTCASFCVGVEVAYDGECMQNCQPVDCDLFCEFGFKVDANGCNLCECNPNPMTVDCSQAPYSDPRYQYLGRSTEECQLLTFSCMDPMVMFSDACGCGCKSPFEQ